MVDAKRQQSYRARARMAREAMVREAPEQAEALAAVEASDIVVVEGTYDHVELVLGELGLPHQSVDPAALRRLTLRPHQLLVVNCPGQVDPRSIVQIREFVAAGGSLFTTDWALRHVVEPAFPGVIAYNDSATADTVVRVEVVDGDNRFLQGVMEPGDDPQGWLEGSSYPIRILDPERVKVLLKSRELGEKWGESPVAVVFGHGQGEVFHMISHYYLQRTELRNARHRSSAALFATEKGVAAGADLDASPWATSSRRPARPGCSPTSSPTRSVEAPDERPRPARGRGPPRRAGRVALYPLFGDGPTAPEYAPGPVASSAGCLRVTEREGGPSVPELTVTNSGLLPLLLVEGESLLGGWQNRTLNVSVLIGAGRRAAVPVSCVERGRWGGAREGARPAPAMSPSALRARKQRAVARGVFAGAPERRSDQGEVWEAVSGYATRFDAAAPTEALADVQQARYGDVMAMVAGTRPLESQRSVAVAIGGRVRSVDFFDRAATLAAYWDALVQGYALDAVDVETDSAPPGRRGVVQAFDSLRHRTDPQCPRRRSGPGGARHRRGYHRRCPRLDDICVHLALHRVPA